MTETADRDLYLRLSELAAAYTPDAPSDEAADWCAKAKAILFSPALLHEEGARDEAGVLVRAVQQLDEACGSEEPAVRIEAIGLLGRLYHVWRGGSSAVTDQLFTGLHQIARAAITDRQTGSAQLALRHMAEILRNHGRHGRQIAADKLQQRRLEYRLLEMEATGCEDASKRPEVMRRCAAVLRTLARYAEHEPLSGHVEAATMDVVRLLEDASGLVWPIVERARRAGIQDIVPLEHTGD